jgi:putative FmdB family regulatory protein
MPTYEYLCRGCGHEFELFQQMSEPLKRKCPECGRLKLQRLIGLGAGVIFKGGGFYETDYRSDSYKKAAEAEKKAADGAAATTNGESSAQKTPPAGETTKTEASASDAAKKPAKDKPRKPKVAKAS